MENLGTLDGFSPLTMSEDGINETMRTARDEGPVVYWPQLDAWVATRYQDIKQILADYETFSSAGVYQSVGWTQETKDYFARAGVDPICDDFMIVKDPPRHTEMRRQLSRVFTPRGVADQELQIRRVVSDCLDRFPRGTAFDFIEACAASIQILVLFKMLNIPEEDLPQLREWVLHLKRLVSFQLSGDEQLACASSAVMLDDYVGQLVAARRSMPTTDFYSDLINHVDESKEPWTESELRAVISPGLILAGFTTTRNVLGFTICNCLSDRRIWQGIIDDPSIISSVVEESLRVSPPFFGFFRTTTRTVELGGVEIPEGARIIWSVFSANRDERKFECPYEFKVGRRDAAQHLSFGYGIHFCIGAPLARLTLKVTLEMLAERFPTLEMSKGAVPRFTQGPVARDFEELMVIVPT
jgi:cytochrome P450